MSKLTSSFSNSGYLENSSYRDAFLRAKALVLFHEKQFNAFYTLIETNQFANENHSFLQELWNEAHYLEVFFLTLLSRWFAFAIITKTKAIVITIIAKANYTDKKKP